MFNYKGFQKAFRIWGITPDPFQNLLTVKRVHSACQIPALGIGNFFSSQCQRCKGGCLTIFSELLQPSTGLWKLHNLEPYRARKRSVTPQLIFSILDL